MVEDGANAPTEIGVTCGAEQGFFEFKRFGPGGASRCIRFVTTTGIHYITPIEFEALGGKEANWKKHVRVTENNKVVKTEIFDKGLVKTCPKGCGCNNCEIARQLPNNLEKLLEIVYSPRKDQSGKSTAISRASLQMVEQSNT